MAFLHFPKFFYPFTFIPSSFLLPFFFLSSFFFLLSNDDMSVLPIISEDSEHLDNDGFFSIPIMSYNHEECLQLAQIHIWNGDLLHIFWCPDKNEILIENGDEFIAQPDDAHIIRSLAHLYGCPEHQIRFSNLYHFSRDDGSPTEQPGDDGLYHLYDTDWRSYGEEGLCFQVVAEVDFHAMGHFIPPVADEPANEPPADVPTDEPTDELDLGLGSMILID